MSMQLSDGIRTKKLNIRVFIIEPDYFGRQWLKVLIARDDRTRVVGAATSLGLTKEQEQQMAQAQVILLSYTALQSAGNALSAFETFRQKVLRSKILLLCDTATELAPTPFLAAGADGILLKAEVCESIASATERACRGNILITASIQPRLEAAPWHLQKRLEVLPPVAHFDELSGRLSEPIFLYAVAGLAKEQIADERQIALNTVRKYLADAYEILAASNPWDAFERLTALADESDEEAQVIDQQEQ